MTTDLIRNSLRFRSQSTVCQKVDGSTPNPDAQLREAVKMANFTLRNPRYQMRRCLALTLFALASLLVKAQESKPPQILPISPAIAYPYDEIHIQGSDFGKDPGAISLLVNGHWIKLESNPDCSTKRSAANQVPPAEDNSSSQSNSTNSICATFHLDATPNQIDLTNLSDAQMKLLSGEARLQVKAANDVTLSSQPGIQIRWSALTQRQVLELSIASGLAMAALLLMLVGFGTRQMIDTGVRSGLFTTFLLDPQTNSLSLSKFQFYAWTAAAISGYDYLLLSSLLVQKSGQFPDVPTSLPWIFGTSIATSIGIGAITVARGPKGAGELRPRLSDLITAGGVVQPDRVQYLVWTLVGVSGYVLTILGLDPRNIKSLPSIPTTLLTLGGVSAAGYVGGRMATKVGPVVDTANLSIAGTTSGAAAVSQPTPAPTNGEKAAPSGGAPSLPANAASAINAIQQVFAASTQNLASLNSANSDIASAIQKVQAGIAKASPLVQLLSPLGTSSLGSSPQLVDDALKAAEEAAFSAAGLAQSNLAGGNTADQSTLKTTAQTADQVLHQVQLLSSFVGRVGGPVPAAITATPGSTPPAAAPNAASPGQRQDPNTSWVLTLRGRGLSRDATFAFADPSTPSMEIDVAIPPLVPVDPSAQIPFDQLTAANGAANPEIVEQDIDASVSDMAKVLRVRFRSSALVTKSGQGGRLNFRITNPDGQSAVFPVDTTKP
jgi:hypothetical protein